jgi:phosphoribosyl 1,2-cyclic phosphate phosphodiesterase
VRITVLGCGTSGGVPRIGNFWGACNPANPKNRRRRVSIAVEQGATRLIVDTSPDLREQCLDADINRLDGVLYTHDHADHTHGIDDLRGLSWAMGGRVPVYGNQVTLDTLMQRFDYVFVSKHGYPAICEQRLIDGPFQVGEIPVVPFEQTHGDIKSIGYRFGKAAYSTDLNRLDDAAFEALAGIDLWIVDALRYEPHPTHAHLDLTLGWIERVKPKRAVLTHMTWDMDYETLKRQLPAGIEPAYDGMVLELD